MRSQRHASHPQMRGYSRETLVSHPSQVECPQEFLSGGRVGLREGLAPKERVHTV